MKDGFVLRQELVLRLRQTLVMTMRLAFPASLHMQEGARKRPKWLKTEAIMHNFDSWIR